VLGIQGGYKSQIYWEGYDKMTWEPALNCSTAKQMLNYYKTQYRLGEMKVKQKLKGYGSGLDGYWVHCAMESMLSRFVYFHAVCLQF